MASHKKQKLVQPLHQFLLVHTLYFNHQAITNHEHKKGDQSWLNLAMLSLIQREHWAQ